jgi:hypothetical protein
VLVNTNHQEQVNELRLEPHSHRYFLGGRELVGVTRSLQAYGLIDYSGIPDAILRRAAKRGRDAHLAFEYFDYGTLDESSLDEEISGHLLAYKNFLRDSGFQVGSIETARYHPTRLYAGKPDRPLGLLHGTACILDFKTGAVQEGHLAQLTGYAHLYPEPRRYRLIALQTKKTGRYKVHEVSPTDFEYWSQQMFRAVQFAQHQLKECA